MTVEEGPPAARSEPQRTAEPLPDDLVVRSIVFVRGERVLLDETLAALYGVSVSQLNQAVRRNAARFPSDFMFQLDDREAEILRSQFVISSSTPAPSRPAASKSRTVTSKAHGGRRYHPYAFTEQGVAMLSSVLRSRRAVEVNIEVMRTFVRLRRWLADHAELAARLDALERRYDARFRAVFDAIRALMQQPPAGERRAVGFRSAAPDEETSGEVQPPHSSTSASHTPASR